MRRFGILRTQPSQTWRREKSKEPLKIKFSPASAGSNNNFLCSVPYGEGYGDMKVILIVEE